MALARASTPLGTRMPGRRSATSSPSSWATTPSAPAAATGEGGLHEISVLFHPSVFLARSLALKTSLPRALQWLLLWLQLMSAVIAYDDDCEIGFLGWLVCLSSLPALRLCALPAYVATTCSAVPASTCLKVPSREHGLSHCCATSSCPRRRRAGLEAVQYINSCSAGPAPLAPLLQV
jgi:hypothetical protein